jgi:hypothetical protein
MTGDVLDESVLMRVEMSDLIGSRMPSQRMQLLCDV